jgi:2-dehydropantoate 2-reductase
MKITKNTHSSSCTFVSFVSSVSANDREYVIDHIYVLGAGAIGSLYAAKLAARHDVTIIARANHVDAIRRHGLRVIGREEATCHVRAETTVDTIPAATLIVLTTKVNDCRTAIAPLVDALRDDTVILCVQNGLGGEDAVREEVGGRCLVLRAITQCGAIFQEPGVVDFKAAGATLVEQSARSDEIASLLSACGLDGRVSEDIKVEIWRKLIFNCVINPITSIVASDVGGIADERLDPLKQLVVDECLRVARAAGVDFDIDFVHTIAEVFGPSRNIASMRQDLLKGKRTEIDHMNGAVVALGRRFGIACPVNAALVSIIKTMEARAVAQ